MRKKKILLTTMIMFCAMSFNAIAQENENPLDTLTRTVAGIRSELDVLKRIKISGYIQAQYQVADSAGAKSVAGGDFSNGVDKRFMVRRGRVKFQYDAPVNDKGWSTSSYVLQFDVSEKGMTIKDAKIKFTDPWSGWFSVTAGMQDRPFGYEIGYSSSLRESPERGRLSQTIFRNERDLGAMLTIQGPKISNWNWVKLDLGLFNGTGGPSAGENTSDFDKFKDMIGHLSIARTNRTERIKWGLGASYYKGGFRLDAAEYEYGSDSLGVKGFVIKTPKADIASNINVRGRTDRNSVGGDGQISIDWMAGITTIRAEFIQGNQPATSGSSTSPISAPSSTTTSNIITKDTSGKVVTVPTTSTGAADIYNRKFNGAYFYFIQNIGHSPLQAVLKYDWYDPNTDVSGDEIGKKTAGAVKATGAADIKYTTLGFGLVYRWDANVKITAYYDSVKNETSTNLSGFQKDLEDNVFTLRVQVKF